MATMRPAVRLAPSWGYGELAQPFASAVAVAVCCRQVERQSGSGKVIDAVAGPRRAQVYSGKAAGLTSDEFGAGGHDQISPRPGAVDPGDTGLLGGPGSSGNSRILAE